MSKKNRFLLFFTALTASLSHLIIHHAHALPSEGFLDGSCRTRRDNGRIKVRDTFNGLRKEICLCGEWHEIMKLEYGDLCGKREIVYEFHTSWEGVDVPRGKHGSECMVFQKWSALSTNSERIVCQSFAVKPPTTPDAHPTPAPILTAIPDTGVCAVNSHEQVWTYKIEWRQEKDGTWNPFHRVLSAQGVAIIPQGTKDENNACQITYVTENLSNGED